MNERYQHTGRCKLRSVQRFAERTAPWILATIRCTRGGGFASSCTPVETSRKRVLASRDSIDGKRVVVVGYGNEQGVNAPVNAGVNMGVNMGVNTGVNTGVNPRRRSTPRCRSALSDSPVMGHRTSAGSSSREITRLGKPTLARYSEKPMLSSTRGDLPPPPHPTQLLASPIAIRYSASKAPRRGVETRRCDIVSQGQPLGELIRHG